MPHCKCVAAIIGNGSLSSTGNLFVSNFLFIVRYVRAVVVRDNVAGHWSPVVRSHDVTHIRSLPHVLIRLERHSFLSFIHSPSLSRWGEDDGGRERGGWVLRRSRRMSDMDDDEDMEDYGFEVLDHVSHARRAGRCVPV